MFVLRSAPEVISDGHYSHASDVWAFGILAWELYTSFASGQDRRDFSIPYHGLYDDEVNLNASGFLSQQPFLITS